MDCIILTAHADNLEKECILRSCISLLKKTGFPIFLSSHIKVRPDIIKEVDYFLYDSDNPVINYEEFDDPSLNGSSVWHYINFPQYSQKFYLSFNHAFAHLMLMKNAISLAESLEFTKAHIVNYDYLVEDINVIIENSLFLKQYDARTYFHSGYEDRVLTAFLSIKINKFKVCFDKINSKWDYASIGRAIFELFTKHVFDINNLSLMNSNVGDLLNRVESNLQTLDIISDYTIVYEEKEVGLIFLSEIEDKYYLFFSIKENLEFNIKTNENNFFVSPSINFPFLIELETDILFSGLEITQKDYNWSIKFDSKSKKARGIINDFSIVHKLA